MIDPFLTTLMNGYFDPDDWDDRLAFLSFSAQNCNVYLSCFEYSKTEAYQWAVHILHREKVPKSRAQYFRTYAEAISWIRENAYAI